MDDACIGGKYTRPGMCLCAVEIIVRRREFPRLLRNHIVTGVTAALRVHGVLRCGVAIASVLKKSQRRADQLHAIVHGEAPSQAFQMVVHVIRR